MKKVDSRRTTFNCHLDKVGNTPLVRLEALELKNINLFAKQEFYNPTGSVKDRAASNIIKKVLDRKEINNSYWVNQYGNPYNADAYYYTLGNEICDQMENID